MPRNREERILREARRLARQLHSEGWTRAEIRAEFRKGGPRTKELRPLAAELGIDWQTFLKILFQLLPLIFLFI